MKHSPIPILKPYNDAFWISPYGCAVLVEATHILMVCEYPVKFGYSAGQIGRVFARHNEKSRTEQNARREIFLDLFKRGWIRTRNYKNSGWTMNVRANSAYQRARIGCFFAKLLSKNRDIRLQPVILDSPSGQTLHNVIEMANEYRRMHRAGSVAEIHFVLSPSDLTDVTFCSRRLLRVGR